MPGDFFNSAAPLSTTDAGESLERARLNAKCNQMVDDKAVLETGLSVSTVVKYDSTDNRWEALDGTVELTGDEYLGIVTYVASPDTSGQVKTGGVHVDSSLTADTRYYCQSDGSLGSTPTEVEIGHCCAAGQLVLKINGGSGGSGSSASLEAFTVDTLDDDGEPTQITVGTTVYTITRDANGRLDTLGDGDTTLTMTYDDDGNLSGATAA
jgi:YD repeat-containing protein